MGVATLPSAEQTAVDVTLWEQQLHLDVDPPRVDQVQPVERCFEAVDLPSEPEAAGSLGLPIGQAPLFQTPSGFFASRHTQTFDAFRAHTQEIRALAEANPGSRIDRVLAAIGSSSLAVGVVTVATALAPFVTRMR